MTITVGEALTGISSSTANIGYQGYRGTTTAPSPFTALYLGQQGLGGTDANPSLEIPASNLVAVQYTTSSVDVSTIALTLLEHGSTTLIDANGNLQVENGRWILYDFENRPIRIVTQDAALIQFTYDFQGNRTQQTTTQLGQSSQTTVYVSEIYEASSSTAPIKYFMAGSLRVAMLDSAGTTSYFLTDHLASTNLLVNNSQSSVRTTRYMPFGSTFQTSGTTDNDHKYTGKRLDATTGLYYYGARYYDPLSGRFISPDSIIQNPNNPQALNRYAYCLNNPIRLLDTDGHRVLEAAIGLAMLAGAEIRVAMANPQSWDAAAREAAIGAIQGLTFSAGFVAGGPLAGPLIGSSASAGLGAAMTGGDAASIATHAALGALIPALWGEAATLAAFGRDSVMARFGQSPPQASMAGEGAAPDFSLSQTAGGITNPVPPMLARVIPGEGPFLTLGLGGPDVYVTDPAAIEGMSPAEIWRRLKIEQSDTYSVIQFPTPAQGVASPILRNDPGFVGGGLTGGGAPEFVIPNGQIPPEATTTIINSPPDSSPDLP
jgi:RHS repeat-associated protein